MAAERFVTSYTDFEPSTFLECHYSKTGNSYNVDRIRHTLCCYHNAFKELPTCLKVLDYGSGPVVLSTISAARKASEIVLSDISGENCKALTSWLNGDTSAFDWSSHFKFVVCELEGKSEKDVEIRQDKVRKLVRAVVHCDISQNPPIERGYDCLYDVVISSLVIESVAGNSSEYVTYLTRLAALVKPGGLLMLYGIDSKFGSYRVGDCNFRQHTVKAEFSISTLQGAGFVNFTVDKFFPDDPNKIFSFVMGTRSK